MTVFNVFNVEEQIVINHAVKGEALSAYKKENLLEYLDFVISTSEDSDIVNLYIETREKAAALTESEWAEMISELPFKTPYSADSGNFDEAE